MWRWPPTLFCADPIPWMSSPQEGVLLVPALGAVLTSGSTVIVAINPRLLRLEK